MSRTTLIIDGRVLMDQQLDEWHQTDPMTLTDMIKPGHQYQPILMTALAAMHDALMASRPIHVEVVTHPGGYILTVNDGLCPT